MRGGGESPPPFPSIFPPLHSDPHAPSPDGSSPHPPFTLRPPPPTHAPSPDASPFLAWCIPPPPPTPPRPLTRRLALLGVVHPSAPVHHNVSLPLVDGGSPPHRPARVDLRGGRCGGDGGAGVWASACVACVRACVRVGGNSGGWRGGAPGGGGHGRPERVARDAGRPRAAAGPRRHPEAKSKEGESAPESTRTCHQRLGSRPRPLGPG